MLTVVESVGERPASLSNPCQDAEEVLSGFLKIIQRAMVKRRSWVNVAVCPCLHPSLTHHGNINPFENKVWEIHIFMKKCVCSFIEVRKLCLIMFPLIFILQLTTLIRFILCKTVSSILLFMISIFFASTTWSKHLQNNTDYPALYIYIYIYIKSD